METHDIHGIKVDFHTGTEGMVKVLRAMPSQQAREIIEHSKGGGKSYLMDSKIRHQEKDGEDHFSFHPRSN